MTTVIDFVKIEHVVNHTEHVVNYIETKALGDASELQGRCVKRAAIILFLRRRNAINMRNRGAGRYSSGTIEGEDENRSVGLRISTEKHTEKHELPP